MKRCSVEDNALVVSILTHPTIYWWVSDDMAPKAEDLDYTPILAIDCIYVLIPRQGCITIFTPRNGVTFEVHSAALPAARGRNMILAGREAIAWMFANTPCRKVITCVPTFNPLAYRLALLCGMQEEGLDRKSFLKDGVLFDQVQLGIQKEVSACQQ